MGLDKQWPYGVAGRHRAEHRVLPFLRQQAVRHKAAGQQQRRAVGGLGQRLGQKDRPYQGFLGVRQAAQQRALAVVQQAFGGKQRAAGGVLGLHGFAPGAVAPVQVALAALLLLGKIRRGALVGDQVLVGAQGAGKGVLAQHIAGAAVLQVAAQHAPVVVDVDVLVLRAVQLPAAQALKRAAAAPGGQRPRHGAGPAALVHQHGAHGAGFVQPGGQRRGVSHFGGKHHRVRRARRAGRAQQVYQHLVRRVADIKVRFHAPPSSSLTGGKWMRPQPAAHSGIVRSLFVTSKANSVTGLSRQTACASDPSKISR